MNRSTGAPAPNAASTAVVGVAPRIETTGIPRSATVTRMSSATAVSSVGLTASTTTSTLSTSSLFESACRPPTLSASAFARPASTGLNISVSGPASAAAHPRASAPAMFPAPTSPTITWRSTLVEEALLQEPRALLGGDLDVARRQQEHLVGDPLHAAVERVREPAREVDQALGQVGGGALQVEDHGDRVL